MKKKIKKNNKVQVCIHVSISIFIYTSAISTHISMYKDFYVCAYFHDSLKSKNIVQQLFLKTNYHKYVLVINYEFLHREKCCSIFPNV